MLDKLTGNQSDPNAIPITNVKIDQISERPELFQLRDTDYQGGDRQTVSKKRVKEIVDRWDPELLDPIMAVRDPEDPETFVVIGGHHRLAAMRELDIDDVPIRILKGDIDDEKDRERLVEMAVVSNFVIAENNIREQANAAYKLHQTGRTHKEIAEKLRLKSPTRAEKLLWLHEAGTGVIERVLLQPELEPAAVELGRAAVKYGMPQETIGGLFSRWVNEYEDTGKVPGQVSLRAQIDSLAMARGEQGDIADQGEMLAGFGGDVVLTEFDKSRKELEELRSEDRKLNTKMNSCERLAQELGINVDSLLIAAEERQKIVKAEIDREESVLIGRPQPKPDDKDDDEPEHAEPSQTEQGGEPGDGFGINLFGDVQELPKFDEEDDEEPVPACPPSIAMFGAGDDAQAAEAEVTPVSPFGMKVSDDVGDDFAPDETPEPSPVVVSVEMSDEPPIPFSVDIVDTSQPDGDPVEVDLPVMAADAHTVELAQPSDQADVTVSEELSSGKISDDAGPETVVVVVNEDALADLPAEQIAEQPKRKKKRKKPSGRDAAIRAAVAKATKTPKKRASRRHPFLTSAESRRR